MHRYIEKMPHPQASLSPPPLIERGGEGFFFFKENTDLLHETYISVTGLLGSIELAVAFYTHSLWPRVAQVAQRYLILRTLVTKYVPTRSRKEQIMIKHKVQRSLLSLYWTLPAMVLDSS